MYISSFVCFEDYPNEVIEKDIRYYMLDYYDQTEREIERERERERERKTERERERERDHMLDI